MCTRQTKYKSGEEKDSFYDDLHIIYDDCPMIDVKIIICDMKAKVGKEDVYKLISGKYCLHGESNDNGLDRSISPHNLAW
jgi:hypothetical protein